MNCLTAMRLAMNELMAAYAEAQKEGGKVTAEGMCIEAQKLITKAIEDMRKVKG